MSALAWGFLIGSVLLLLVLLAPIHMVISYNETGFSVLLRVYFIRVCYPKKKKVTQKNNAKTSESTSQKGGDYQQLFALLRHAVSAAGKLLKAIRVHNLVMDITVATDDPFKTAMIFGGSGAGVGLLLPYIESHFTIKKKSINVQANFAETEMKASVSADCMILTVQLLAIALCFAYNFLKEQKMNASKNRKDGQNGRTES